MRKNFLVVIFLIAGIAGGTIGGSIILFPQITDAQNDRDYWYNEYNNLQDDYDDLLQNYNDLWDYYDNLEADYWDLQALYYSLFADYEALQETFEEPLTYPDIPTINEVINWLAIDDTDEALYTQYWMCGDFSAMLMTRTKAMNWRMRIACMFWSYEGDIGWQDPAHPYGEYGHAFNFIYCIDGSDPDSLLDLYYIEPQTDKVWYVHYGSFNHLSYSIWSTFGGGLSGTVWSEAYFINHYSEFA